MQHTGDRKTKTHTHTLFCAFCSSLAYWVAFGPHGARTPLTGPNHTLKVLAGTSAIVAAAGGLFLWIRSKGMRPSCRLLNIIWAIMRRIRSGVGDADPFFHDAARPYLLP